MSLPVPHGAAHPFRVAPRVRFRTARDRVFLTGFIDSTDGGSSSITDSGVVWRLSQVVKRRSLS